MKNIKNITMTLALVTTIFGSALVTESFAATKQISLRQQCYNQANSTYNNACTGKLKGSTEAKICGLNARAALLAALSACNFQYKQ